MLDNTQPMNFSAALGNSPGTSTVKKVSARNISDWLSLFPPFGSGRFFLSTPNILVMARRGKRAAMSRAADKRAKKEGWVGRLPFEERACASTLCMSLNKFLKSSSAEIKAWSAAINAMRTAVDRVYYHAVLLANYHVIRLCSSSALAGTFCHRIIDESLIHAFAGVDAAEAAEGAAEGPAEGPGAAEGADGEAAAAASAAAEDDGPRAKRMRVQSAEEAFVPDKFFFYACARVLNADSKTTVSSRCTGFKEIEHSRDLLFGVGHHIDQLGTHQALLYRFTTLAANVETYLETEALKAHIATLFCARLGLLKRGHGTYLANRVVAGPMYQYPMPAGLKANTLGFDTVVSVERERLLHAIGGGPVGVLHYRAGLLGEIEAARAARAIAAQAAGGLRERLAPLPLFSLLPLPCSSPSFVTLDKISIISLRHFLDNGIVGLRLKRQLSVRLAEGETMQGRLFDVDRLPRRGEGWSTLPALMSNGVELRVRYAKNWTMQGNRLRAPQNDIFSRKTTIPTDFDPSVKYMSRQTLWGAWYACAAVDPGMDPAHFVGVDPGHHNVATTARLVKDDAGRNVYVFFLFLSVFAVGGLWEALVLLSEAFSNPKSAHICTGTSTSQ